MESGDAAPMRNYRFYLADSKLSETEILVEDEAQLHKMNKVLRLSQESKEELEFFDGEGKVYEVELETISAKEAKFKITNSYESKRELKTKVKFLIPIIKPENYYWMLRKLTELGVSEFQPVFFARSQKKYLESIAKHKDKALNIIEEAVEQCGAAKLPIYKDSVDFETLYSSIKSQKNLDELRIYAYEELSLESSEDLKNLIQEKPALSDTVIMVGPEGGLTTDENKNLGDIDFSAVSLGVRLLKAETAAVTLFASLGIE